MLPSVKCVVVGDPTVGKTCLIKSYATGVFDHVYVPTIYDIYTTDKMVEGQLISLTLWDTAGQDEYDLLRPVAYPQTKVVVICFSVDNPTSYENVRHKWYPEMQHHCPRVPIVLVGTKVDMRENGRDIAPETLVHGNVLSREIKAVKYVECSALTMQGVKDVFEAAILAYLRPEIRKQPRACQLL